MSFFLLASVAATPGEPPQPPSTSPASRESRQTLSIRLVDEARLSSRVERQLWQEVEAIWEAQGIAIEWVGEHGPKRTDAIIFAILRPRGGPAPRKAGRVGHRRTTLGWIRFGPNGEPANLIEISCEAVRRTANRGRYQGSPLNDLPLVLQDELVGRALGRVLAHEIGHWLLGPAHAESGLMKPGMSPDELLDHRPPHLNVSLPSPARRTDVAP